ncbi:MAG: sigma-70 family RNA polymerase sigma factor [Clostridiales bacterium]|jgi:RNA polymerase sigma-70 factor (ECF subfamily)|nr:sigma-70 family RNA polymerase sigma factor [Clostridiales bacterium]
MTTINLRDYYPIYKEDTFIDVSDEIATFLAEEKRLQTNYEQYIRDNKAFYSLDCGDGIETGALDKPEQPDEAYERAEIARLLDEALVSMPETQRRRVYAHIVLQMDKTRIATAENVSEGSVRESILRGIANLEKFLKKLF